MRVVCAVSYKYIKYAKHTDCTTKFFIFSMPCITIQLLQFKTTNAHNFIRVTTIL
jgi:hypothetical protein